MKRVGSKGATGSGQACAYPDTSPCLSRFSRKRMLQKLVERAVGRFRTGLFDRDIEGSEVSSRGLTLVGNPNDFRPSQSLSIPLKSFRVQKTLARVWQNSDLLLRLCAILCLAPQVAQVLSCTAAVPATVTTS
jgi:hypothetical protein